MVKLEQAKNRSFHFSDSGELRNNLRARLDKVRSHDEGY